MAVGGSNRRGGRGPRKSPPRRGTSPRSKPTSGSNGAARGKPPERLAFAIPSDHKKGREIQDQILQAARRHGFDGQDFFAIKLALEEGIANAIKHGNRLDPEKKVSVQADFSARRVRIVIEDEGPGFSRDDVPDPTSEENLEKCSGRGILLIESYMTKVLWDRGGRRLTLVKEIE